MCWNKIALACPANTVYKDDPPACPDTCLNPNGNPNCPTKIQPVPGCYCAQGLVLDSTGNCIPSAQCGCSLPDKSGHVSVYIIYFINQ